MSYRHGLFDTIADTLAPVHRDGHKFIAAALLVTLLLFLLWPPLGWVLALVTAWMIYFFRDPDRVVPMREGLVVSAADGRIAMIEKVRPVSWRRRIRSQTSSISYGRSGTKIASAPPAIPL